ncbi:hypothetical protein SDRG_16160 [Saprolegnia diclina VS20]|uniref:TAFII55 protein conserved region domain-containing protein n=1 Tax=Saprolegnia diclina (strain VS20) TaxID=1156394 RepID=T0R1Y2_SAPDV|nr:hypothetical protein SDRG_16160 [Saprolegnia diclina VS20]EQC26013.1 hypothetical protein SDRG_16160 [Saprolegnia diclina VS20]|eukprot:XP_008620581.1 hypothetical protein SDRG_16160 [Saprolegnia diclina VS20]
MMEQYLLRVPKKVGTELRKKIQDKDIKGVDMVAGADNKHFKFHLGDQEYPVTLNQLPCILETHKTYDDNLFYKSGEIGQIFMVHENTEKQKLYEDVAELPSGITPPTTNIVKRKYSKTKKYPTFPKTDVARVEDSLIRIMGGGVIEDVQEELVDYCDWMVTDAEPQGIVVYDEMDLIVQHPEYLTISKKKDPNEKDGNSAGSVLAERRQAIEDARTPADVLSEEDDDMDDDGKSKPATAASTPTNSGNKSAEDDDFDEDMERMLNEDMDDDDDDDKYNLQEDPQYVAFVRQRQVLQKKLHDLETEILTNQASISSATNFVLKQRFQVKDQTLQQQKAQLQDSLNETNQSIRDLEAKANV